MKTYCFVQYLNQSFVLKASLWLYIILTQEKMNRICYYIIQFYRKGKGMKCAKHPSVFRTGFLPLAKNLLIPSPLGNTPPEDSPCQIFIPLPPKDDSPIFHVKIH